MTVEILCATISVVRERITIGNRVIIHANAAIGADGFGYRWNGSAHQKIPHIGTIIIEDDVEIGSCVCIDRAKYSFTKIGRGTKMDNLVQVAHNVRTGPHCIVVGQAGMAGSVTLGAGVMLGGQCAVRDHVKGFLLVLEKAQRGGETYAAAAVRQTGSNRRRDPHD